MSVVMKVLELSFWQVKLVRIDWAQVHCCYVFLPCYDKSGFFFFFGLDVQSDNFLYDHHKRTLRKVSGLLLMLFKQVAFRIGQCFYISIAYPLMNSITSQDRLMLLNSEADQFFNSEADQFFDLRFMKWQWFQPSKKLRRITSEVLMII